MCVALLGPIGHSAAAGYWQQTNLCTYQSMKARVQQSLPLMSDNYDAHGLVLRGADLLVLGGRKSKVVKMMKVGVRGFSHVPVLFIPLR